MPDDITDVVEPDDTEDGEPAAATFGAIFGVEIMRVGIWNGRPFTLTNLQQLVDAYRRVGFKPPVKLGHTDEPGTPAYGWVRDLRLEGDRLLCDMEDVPEDLINQIRQRRYDAVSCEVWFDTSWNGEKFPRVLKAVAVLGGHPPAVTGLKPLRAALDAFSFEGEAFPCSDYQELTMTEKTGAGGADQKAGPSDQQLALLRRIEELETKLAANGGDAALKIQALTDQLNLHQSMLAAAQREKVEAQIAGAVARLKVPALRPHLRALMSFVAEVQDKDGKPLALKFQAIGDDEPRDTSATAIVEDLIERLNRGAAVLLTEHSTSSYSGERSDGGENEADDPSVRIETLARKHMQKHGETNFSAAVLAVLEDPANARLARQYQQN